MVVAFSPKSKQPLIGEIYTIWQFEFNGGPSAKALIQRVASYDEWIKDGKERWTPEQLKTALDEPCYQTYFFYEVSID